MRWAGEMTPDERDRMKALEVEMEGVKEWLKSMDGKLDEIRTAAHMGKGAWVMMLRMGAGMAAIAAAMAWLLDHFHK